MGFDPMESLNTQDAQNQYNHPYNPPPLLHYLSSSSEDSRRFTHVHIKQIDPSLFPETARTILANNLAVKVLNGPNFQSLMGDSEVIVPKELMPYFKNKKVTLEIKGDVYALNQVKVRAFTPEEAKEFFRVVNLIIYNAFEKSKKDTGKFLQIAKSYTFHVPDPKVSNKSKILRIKVVFTTNRQLMLKTQKKILDKIQEYFNKQSVERIEDKKLVNQEISEIKSDVKKMAVKETIQKDEIKKNL